MTPVPDANQRECLGCKAPMTPQEIAAYGGRCEDCFAWAGKHLSHNYGPGIYNADARKDGRVSKKGVGDG